MTIGLWVFISVIVLDVAGLLTDGGLALLHMPTITGFVQTTLSGQIAGLLILFVQLLGVVGLFCHFFPSFA
jgi:hypothetical protein